MLVVSAVVEFLFEFIDVAYCVVNKRLFEECDGGVDSKVWGLKVVNVVVKGSDTKGKKNNEYN